MKRKLWIIAIPTTLSLLTHFISQPAHNVSLDLNNISDYRYIIIKQANHYFLKLQPNHPPKEPYTSAIGIGSSPVDLEEFMNTNVKVSGAIRKDFGYMLCINKTENCNKQKAVVLDIENIEITDTL